MHSVFINVFTTGNIVSNTAILDSVCDTAMQPFLTQAMGGYIHVSFIIFKQMLDLVKTKLTKEILWYCYVSNQPILRTSNSV